MIPTFDTLLSPLRRLSPGLQLRLWGVALILALTTTDLVGVLSRASAERQEVSLVFLLYVGVYTIGSLITCQLAFTPFVQKESRLVWRWIAVIAGFLIHPLTEIIPYAVMLRPEVFSTASAAWNTYVYSLLATSGPRLVLWFAVMLVVLHQVKRQQEQVRLRDLETAIAKAQLARLETQINPHFLFNALNTVSALITLDRKPEARGAVTALADLLRLSLKHDAEPLATIAEERASAEIYLHIEALRFPDRLRVEWKVEDRFADVLIPRFTVQTLLENVVKHSVSRTEQLVTATVETIEQPDSTCCLRVRNDRYTRSTPCIESNGDRSGVGITNLKQRVEILFPETGKLSCGPVDDDYFECRLCVPRTHPALPPDPVEGDTS